MSSAKRMIWTLTISGWIVAIGLFALVWRFGLFQNRPAASVAGAVTTAQTHCGVCGSVIESPEGAPKVIFMEKEHRFCTQRQDGVSHKDLFLMDPHHYAEGTPKVIPPTPTVTPTPRGMLYVITPSVTQEPSPAAKPALPTREIVKVSATSKALGK
jgi:hypothetical protein